MCIKHLTVKQLKNLCKEQDIKGYSKLKKQELIDLLKQEETEQTYNCDICVRRNFGSDELFGECADCEGIMCHKCEGIICEETGETYCRECYKKYSECCLCNKDINKIKEEDKWTVNECGSCQKNFCGECFENDKGKSYDGHGDLYYLRHNGYCAECLEEMNSSICGSDCESDSEEEEKDIDEMSVKELKVLCKSKGIKGYSKLKKQELIDLLKQEEENMCAYCEENIEEGDDECPTTCMGCEKMYHGYCARKGAIRFIEKDGLDEDWCYECKEEGESDDDCEEMNTCSVCNEKKYEDDVQSCPQCEEYICVDCIEGDKCEELEIDDEIIFFCHSSCVEHYKVKNEMESDSEEEEDKTYECGKCNCEIHHYASGDLDYSHCEECDKNLCEDCFDSRDETGDCEFCYECYLKTTDINSLKVSELKTLCKLKGLKRYSKLKKQELITYLKTGKEPYWCLCMECAEEIKGATEEWFTEDDELKLCDKCEEKMANE